MAALIENGRPNYDGMAHRIRYIDQLIGRNLYVVDVSARLEPFIKKQRSDIPRRLLRWSVSVGRVSDVMIGVVAAKGQVKAMVIKTARSGKHNFIRLSHHE